MHFSLLATPIVSAKHEIQRGAAESPALVSTQDVVLTLVGIKQD